MPAPDPLTELFKRVRTTFEKKQGAIVQVEAEDSHGTIRGTGFYIDALGTIYTLASITAGTDNIRVRNGERHLPAELLFADTRSGIALIRTEGGNPFLKVRNPPADPIATPVMTIGYPLDMDAAPGFGIISSIDRKFGGIFFSTSHLRIGMPVQRGQGGAPLMDLDGNVLGIITSSVDGGATCHALPIQAAEKLRKDYVRFGEPRHGWVGVKVEETDGNLPGARIRELEASSPAASAGVRPGDILREVGGRTIERPEDVLDASFFLTEGDHVRISVLRDGENLEFRLTPARHPICSPTLQAGTPSLLRLTE